MWQTVKERMPSAMRIVGGVVLGIVALYVLWYIGSVASYGIGQKGVSTSSSNYNQIGAELGLSTGSPSGGFADSLGLSAPELSLRNIIPEPPIDNGSIGSDAEDFEVTEYYSQIETNDLDETCAVVADLKGREEVVFESANTSDSSCHYSFKVVRASADEIVGVIESLDPKELTENTHTIKRQLDDFTSELEILERQQASIESTLESALRSYDEISTIATQSNNADALTKVIDSKIRIIERLTQQRLSVSAQIERLQRSKAEQLDRLEFTQFRVNIAERKFVDGEALRDSWKQATRSFVFEINHGIQALTLGLVNVLVIGLRYLVYALLLIFIGKHLWRYLKREATSDRSTGFPQQ